MKKTLTILTIIAIALVAMMSSVNAATFTASPAETTKLSAGDTVTVTLGTTGASGIQFDLAYPAGFEYVKAEGASICEVNTDTAGQLTVLNFGSDKVVITFKATQEMTADKEALVKEFTVSNYQASDVEETTTSGVAKVTINPVANPDPSPSGDPDPKPSPSEVPSPSPSSETEGDGVEGTNGDELNELPKTGAPVYVGAIAVIVLAGAVLVVRKIRK